MRIPALSALVCAAACLWLSAPAHAAEGAVCNGVSETTNTTLQSNLVVSGLTGRPLFVTSPPGDTQRIFVVEQNGFIRIHKRGDPPGTTSLFLDLSLIVSTFGDEMGLLGLAFAPDYATSGLFYVNYTERTGAGAMFTVVAQYAVSANPDVADPTELRILRFSQPETNHNGGQLFFGLDGFLYVSSGDGGGGGDVHGTCGNGQNNNTLLGKMLRIDVRGVDPNAGAPDCGGTTNYEVPSDNPFRDGPGGSACDENWAWGLRNPWRSSQDAGTGDVYIADVGQGCWEEINYAAAAVAGGENYGWRQMEGTRCYNPTLGCEATTGRTCTGVPNCNDPAFTLPVHSYSSSDTVPNPDPCSVTGGYVYRGCRMSAIRGKYFYGDYCNGFVRSFVVSGGVATNHQDWSSQLDPGNALDFGLTSFGEDAQGELYLVDRSGTVTKMVPPMSALEVSAVGAADQLLLSKTGDWTWEDLSRSAEVAVGFYRVYRGVPNGAFTCVHKALVPRWAAGGDPAVPAAGELYAYVVTAVSPTNEESATGHPGTFDGTTCP